MKDAVVGKLFGAAAGRCSICRINLFMEQVKIGEMAHIIAKSNAGPRGFIEYNGDRDTYDNLILLCANHHTVVDGNETEYPIWRLREIKATHEEWVNSCLKPHSNRQMDVAGLQALMRFLPFTRLRSAVELLPFTFHQYFVYAATAVEAFPMDNPQCSPFTDPKLEQLYSLFVQRLQDLTRNTLEFFPNKHSYVYREDGVLVLNRDLSYHEKTALKSAAGIAINELIPRYLELLEYLRCSYPEVDITAFRL